MEKFQYEGCTATIVFVWTVGENKYLQAANVGDSSAYLCRGNSTVSLSVDHKVSSFEEKERIRKCGIEVNENQTRINGMAVSRTLGDSFLKKTQSGIISEPFISKPILLNSSDSILHYCIRWDVGCFIWRKSY